MRNEGIGHDAAAMGTIVWYIGWCVLAGLWVFGVVSVWVPAVAGAVLLAALCLRPEPIDSDGYRDVP